jgi:hypothetical protein
MFSLLKGLFSTSTSGAGPMGYIYAALAAMLFSAFVGLSGGVYYYKTSYEKAVVAKATIEQQLVQAQADLKTCSDHTEALHEDSVLRSKAAEDALVKAQAESKALRTKADALLQSIPSSPDSCTSAKDLMKTYLTGYVK